MTKRERFQEMNCTTAKKRYSIGSLLGILIFCLTLPVQSQEPEFLEGVNSIKTGHLNHGFKAQLSGDYRYNQSLSELRAESVRDWFIQNGLDPKSLKAKGFGETRPTAPNKLKGKDNPEGRALNRRVELKTKTKQKVTALPKTRAPKAVPAKRVKAPRAKRPPTIIPPRYNKHGELIKPGKRIDHN